MSCIDDIGDPLGAVELRSRREKVVVEPTICRGVDTPGFGHVNCPYFRQCGRLSLSSVHGVRELGD